MILCTGEDEHAITHGFYHADTFFRFLPDTGAPGYKTGSRKIGAGRMVDTYSFYPADPDIVIGISIYIIYMVIVERIAITDDVSEDFERISVIAVQAIVSAKPHEAIMVLVDTGNGIIGEA